jgi:hypothetical protein
LTGTLTSPATSPLVSVVMVSAETGCTARANPVASEVITKPRRDQLGRDGCVPSSTGTMLSMLSMAVLLRVISFAQEDRGRGGGALARVARRHRGRDASHVRDLSKRSELSPAANLQIADERRPGG